MWLFTNEIDPSVSIEGIKKVIYECPEIEVSYYANTVTVR